MKKDIFSARIPSDTFDRIAENIRELVKPSIDDDTARRIVRSVGEADSPVIYAGGEILLAQASEELREFVDHMGVPVAHSLTGKGAMRDELLNEEVFISLADAHRKIAIWRYDYNTARPHSVINGDTPRHARRALEQIEGSAPGALANPSTMSYAEPGLTL